MATEEIMKNWEPILDSLNVSDEKIREIMVDYALIHIKKETESSSLGELHQIHQTPENNITTDYSNLVPVALKILSKLNLENKNVSFEEGQPNLMFSVDIKETTREDLNNIQDLVRDLENQLIEKISDYINSEFSTKDNLIITLIAQSISLISESVGENHFVAPRMQIMSRFSVE